MTKELTAEKYLKRHVGVINEALNDYAKWFSEKERPDVTRALKDMKKLEYLGE